MQLLVTGHPECASALHGKGLAASTSVGAYQAGDDKYHKGDAHQRGRLAQLLHGGEACRKLGAGRGHERQHGQAAVDHLGAGPSECKHTAAASRSSDHVEAHLEEWENTCMHIASDNLHADKKHSVYKCTLRTCTMFTKQCIRCRRVALLQYNTCTQLFHFFQQIPWAPHDQQMRVASNSHSLMKDQAVWHTQLHDIYTQVHLGFSNKKGLRTRQTWGWRVSERQPQAMTVRAAGGWA